jgi:hypothetical protein
VDPARGAAKAATVLDAGGRIGVFWNFGEFPPELRDVLAAIYARLAPELVNRAAQPGAGHPNVELAIAGIAANGAFEDPRSSSFHWTQRYDAAGWRDLLGTHSDHLTLAADRRERLLDAVDDAIGSTGGSLVMPYETTLVEARRV